MGFNRENFQRVSVLLSKEQYKRYKDFSKKEKQSLSSFLQKKIIGSRSMTSFDLTDKKNEAIERNMINLIACYFADLNEYLKEKLDRLHDEILFTQNLLSYLAKNSFFKDDEEEYNEFIKIALKIRDEMFGTNKSKNEEQASKNEHDD